jgi:hypothetical protein
MNALRLLAASLAGSLLLAGCSGGSSSPTPHAAAADTTAGAAKNVQLLVRIPAKTSAAAHARTPAYVSPATTHVNVSLLTNNGNTVNYNYGGFPVTASTPGCTTQSDGSQQCAITLVTPVNVPIVGNDVFELLMTNDAAANLSHADVPVTVSPTQSASIPVTLNGVVSSVAVTLTSGTPVPGSPSTATVVVTAKDAAGYTIVGPGGYDTPVTLTDGDTSGDTALSTTTVSAPGQTVTLSFNGDVHLQYAKITPSVAGQNLAPANAVPGFLLPQPQAPYLYLSLANSTSFIVGYPLAWVRGSTTGIVRPGLLITLPGVNLNRGIAVDHAGDVFAAAYTGASGGAGQVFRYAPGTSGTSPAPAATIAGASTGLQFANCCGAPIKVSANGTLFVYSNGVSPNPAIDEFSTAANGNVAPSVVIASKGANASDTDVNAVTAMATDASGNLTVGDDRGDEISDGRQNAFETFPAGSTTGPFSLLGLDANGSARYPTGLSYDPLGRGLYAIVRTSSSNYVALASSPATPVFTLPGALGGLKTDGLDQDAQGYFYVNGGTGGPSLIYVFAPDASGAPAPVGTLNCCTDPTGLTALANVSASGPIAVQR